MSRRPYRNIFLDKLRELSGGEQKFVGNYTLQNQLGWLDERYNRIHAALAEDGAIVVGRGKGGSVKLSGMPGAKALKVFISYSHVDEEYKNELVKHLEPLRKLGLIETWHDQKIKGGESWQDTISDNLERADIVLLLISIDFINSPYCYGIELDKALELHAAKKARVIPIILRNCLWTHTPFSTLQALPKGVKAIAAWTCRDDAYASVAEELKLIADELVASK